MKQSNFFGNWYKNGPDSVKGNRSIEKMNFIHKSFNISNEQYLYTLSTECGKNSLLGGIYFESQESIDQFLTDYPGCSEIWGNVAIADPLPGRGAVL